MERTKLFQRKGKESHWHWQRRVSRKRWKRCEIIKTSEHTENSKSVLNPKDAGARVWNQQPSPVASSVASSSPQTETSTTVGTVDAIECTTLDLCATAFRSWLNLMVHRRHTKKIFRSRCNGDSGSDCITSCGISLNGTCGRRLRNSFNFSAVLGAQGDPTSSWRARNLPPLNSILCSAPPSLIFRQHVPFP